MTKRKKWGMVLLLLPGALLILCFFMQVIVRFTLPGATNTDPSFSDNSLCETSSGSTTCESTSGIGNAAVAARILNVLTLLTGMVAVVGLLPSVVVGIILLTTPGKQGAAALRQPLGDVSVSQDPPSTDVTS